MGHQALIIKENLLEWKDVGNSVLDYFISNPKLTKYELAIKYWPFNDLSNHRPI